MGHIQQGLAALLTTFGHVMPRLLGLPSQRPFHSAAAVLLPHVLSCCPLAPRPLLPPPQVGEHMRRWEAGKVMVCETSFYHETFNNTPETRIVLIMRHWHPEVRWRPAG